MGGFKKVNFLIGMDGLTGNERQKSLGCHQSEHHSCDTAWGKEGDDQGPSSQSSGGLGR